VLEPFFQTMDTSRTVRNTDGSALYHEIKALTQELSTNDKRVTKRRETGKRLLELLSKEKTRNRLNEKAISLALKKGYSPAKAKRWAVSVVWTPIITSAFASATFLANERKGKLDPDDVKLPLRLLHYSESSVESNRVRIESSCKLSEKNIKTILQFCIEMYYNDTARSLAEVELMNTLIFLCERVDYVAFFRPHTELVSIMKIVEDCLIPDNEGWARSSDSAVAASRIFGAVLESCHELGVGLHLFVSEGLELVARWCKRSLENVRSSPREVSYLFRGISTLLRFHPEQAIQPLTRYGGAILRYAKRVYQHSASVNRHAIHGYL
jgi:hypothetical protein